VFASVGRADLTEGGFDRLVVTRAAATADGNRGINGQVPKEVAANGLMAFDLSLW
jgi:hypothetical protein